MDDKVATQIADARAASNMTTIHVDENINGLVNEINSNALYNEMTVDKPDVVDYNAELLRQLQTIERFGALKSQTIPEIADAVKWSEETVEQAIAEQDAKVKAKKERDRGRREILMVAVDAHRGKRKTKGLISPMMYEDLLIDMVRSAKGAKKKNAVALINELMLDISRANQALRIETLAEYQKLSSAISEIYGVKGDLAVEKKLRELGQARGEFQIFSNQNEKLSTQQMIQIIAWGDQEQYAPVAEAQGRDIQSMRKALSEQDLKLLDWLRDYYVGTRDSLSEVSERVSGMPVKSPDSLYMPVSLINAMQLAVINAPQIIPKSLSTRVANKRDINEKIGVLDIFGDRLHSNAVFKNFAELSIDMRGVFAASDLQQAIVQAHGEKYLNQIMTHTIDIMTQKPAGGDNDTMSKVLMNFGISKLWLSLGPALRQVSSVPAFAYNHGMMNTLKYVGLSGTKEGRKAFMEIMRSDEGIARFKAGQSYIMSEAFSADSQGNIPILGVVKKFAQKYGMAPNKAMDMLTIATVGSGIYRAHLDDASSQGITNEAERKKWAMDKTWQEVEQTQQSSFISQQTSWQRNKGALGKLVGMFTSTPQQFLSRELRDVRAALSSPSTETYKQAGRTLLINHIWMPTLFWSMGLLFKSLRGDEPDEDEWQNWLSYAIVGPFSGWFLGGKISTAVVNSVITGRSKYYGGNFVPASGVIRDSETATKAMRALFEADTEEARKEFVDLLESNAPLYRDLSRFYKQKIKDSDKPKRGHRK